MILRNLPYVSYEELIIEIQERCDKGGVVTTKFEIDTILHLLQDEYQKIPEFFYIDISLLISYLEECGLYTIERASIMRIAQEIFKELGFQNGMYVNTYE